MAAINWLIRRLPDPISTLKKVTDRLTKNTGLVPFVATEIEFYLENDAPHITAAMFPDCYKRFGSAGILTHKIEKETAKGQYEISLVHLPDPLVAAHNTVTVIDIIKTAAEEYASKALFAPKPYKDMPGSGMHIHVSLYDSEGDNVFQKDDTTNPNESDAMCHAIAGLCLTMNEAMVFFAPNEESYDRYTAEFNKQGDKYNHAPVNISWGGNNRTVAIRIPTSTLYPEKRHIEHRVSGPDADPYLAIAAVLAGIDYGITNHIALKENKIWGNAFDKQYNLPPLPKSLKEAKDFYNSSRVIKEYL